MYRLDVAGNETVLYDFQGGSDTGMPTAGVIRDGQANLYGTSNSDGPGGGGDVYKLDAAGRYTLLHSFSGGGDGGVPEAGLVLDAQRNLYGTAGGGLYQNGVVYKSDPSGVETVLYAFTGGADGGNPYGGVTLDAAGNIYGTTMGGGTGNAGVIFKLTPH